MSPRQRRPAESQTPRQSGSSPARTGPAGDLSVDTGRGPGPTANQAAAGPPRAGHGRGRSPSRGQPTSAKHHAALEAKPSNSTAGTIVDRAERRVDGARLRPGRMRPLPDRAGTPRTRMPAAAPMRPTARPPPPAPSTPVDAVGAIALMAPAVRPHTGPRVAGAGIPRPLALWGSAYSTSGYPMIIQYVPLEGAVPRPAGPFGFERLVLGCVIARRARHRPVRRPANSVFQAPQLHRPVAGRRQPIRPGSVPPAPFTPGSDFRGRVPGCGQRQPREWRHRAPPAPDPDRRATAPRAALEPGSPAPVRSAGAGPTPASRRRPGSREPRQRSVARGIPGDSPSRDGSTRAGSPSVEAVSSRPSVRYGSGSVVTSPPVWRRTRDSSMGGRQVLRTLPPSGASSNCAAASAPIRPCGSTTGGRW